MAERRAHQRDCGVLTLQRACFLLEGCDCLAGEWICLGSRATRAPEGAGPGSTAVGITPHRFCIVPGARIRQLSLSNATSGGAPRETSTGKSVHLDPASDCCW